MWCSTISTDRPASPVSDRITSTSSGTSSALTPAIGSSSSITAVRRPAAGRSPACASRRGPGCRPAPSPRWVRPTRSSAASAAAATSRSAAARRHSCIDPPRCACTASRTFSRTLSEPKTDEAWKVRPSPSRARRCGGSVADVPPVQQHPALGGPAQPGDQVEQRGLAGAVRPDHAEELPRREVEVDAVDDGDLADPPGQPAGGEHAAPGAVPAGAGGPPGAASDAAGGTPVSPSCSRPAARTRRRRQGLLRGRP